MLAAFFNLLWKEWRDAAMTAALGVFVVGGFTAIGLQSRLIPDLVVLTISLIIGGLFYPVLAGMFVFAPERTEGTMATLLRLPVRPEVVLVAKLLPAAAGVLVPIASSLAAFLLIAGGREVEPWQPAVLYAAGAAMAVMVLLWTVCPTLGLRSEALVGLIGLAIQFAPLLVLDVVSAVIPTGWIVPFTSLCWIALVQGGTSDVTWPLTLGSQLCVAAALCAFALWRLRRIGRSEG